MRELKDYIYNNQNNIDKKLINKAEKEIIFNKNYYAVITGIYGLTYEIKENLDQEE